MHSAAINLNKKHLCLVGRYKWVQRRGAGAATGRWVEDRTRNKPLCPKVAQYLLLLAANLILSRPESISWRHRTNHIEHACTRIYYDTRLGKGYLLMDV